jgi:hypothetical protein
VRGLILLFASVAAASSGCSQTQHAQSWFPLGGEVYHEGDRDEAAQQLLAFRAEPRWFKPMSREVTKAEHDAWWKEVRSRPGCLMEEMQVEETDHYCIPGTLPPPRRATDLPVEDRGVTLKLNVAPTDNAAVLRFELTLASRSRDVEREVEHRSTNVLPFLFAFEADGRPVVQALDAWVSEGGTEWSPRLVGAGESRTWLLKVDTESLAKLLPPGTKEVAVIAAFSDRQHEGWREGSARLLDFEVREDRQPQVLVRSNVAKLWVVAGRFAARH